jgi:hypothetical protein
LTIPYLPPYPLPPPVAEARKFFEKNSYIPFKIFLNFQFPNNRRYGMSNYHRSAKRTRERNTPEVVNWGSPHRSMDIQEIDRKEPVKIKQTAQKKASIENKLAAPKIHANVSKASKDVQKSLKKSARQGKIKIVK